MKRGAKPVKAKRAAPRRGNVEDPKRLAWAATQPCQVTQRMGSMINGSWYPATTHHVRAFGSPKDDTRIIRLVVELHQHDFEPFSIERIGKAKWEKFWGVNVEALISDLQERYAAYQKEQGE